MASGEEPQASNLVVVLVHAMGVNGIVLIYVVATL
jgi:hypothetical protein